jgi:small subunit ribosomal protein S19e
MRDIQPQKLVEKVSEELKKDDNIKPPEWSKYVKTGVCVERPPIQDDWWFLRSAALLRRVYLDGPIGIQRLRVVFGGRRRRGHKPAHQRKAGGKVIRLMLQQLEKAGYIQKVEKPRKGRIITSKGQRFLNKIAKGIK